MRVLRGFAVVLLSAMTALFATIAPAAATKGGSVTYSGTFTGIIYAGSQAECPTEPVTGDLGTWTVTVHGQAASAYFDITDHVAYAAPNMKLGYPVGGTEFVAYGKTGAGLLTVTLYTGGRFSYVIAPYNNTGLGLPGPTIICDSVTYTGQQTIS